MGIDVIVSLTDKITQVHFTFSSQHTFHAGGNNGGRWPYQQFYHDILSVATSMDKDDQKELLDWWDEYVFWFCFVTRPLMLFLSQVFRDVEPELEREDKNAQPTCCLIATWMKMQAKATAAAKENTAIEVHNAAAATATTKENQL